LDAGTHEPVVTDSAARIARPVHVVSLKCKHGHTWSPAITKHPETTDHETRDRVLKLLSADEVTRLRTKKAISGLADGDEYIDLAAPENGVRTVHGAMQLTMGQVLARKAVSAETWAKISRRFGTRFATAH
jgi:hypothetical protein